jgi:hypothetical protein
MTQISEDSKALADYLVKYGKNPDTEDGSQLKDSPSSTYQIAKELDDGRILTSRFEDRGNQGTDNPSSNSKLFSHMKSTNDGQYGYQISELGLTGKVYDLIIEFGNSESTYDEMFFNGFALKKGVQDNPIGKRIKKTVQARYEKFKIETYINLTE